MTESLTFVRGGAGVLSGPPAPQTRVQAPERFGGVLRFETCGPAGVGDWKSFVGMNSVFNKAGTKDITARLVADTPSSDRPRDSQAVKSRLIVLSELWRLRALATTPVRGDMRQRKLSRTCVTY